VQTPISFILNYFKRNYNLNNEHDQLEFLNQSLQEIVKLQSPVEIDMYVGRVADEMNVSKEAINKELDSLRRQMAIKQPANNYKDVQQHALEKVTSSVKSEYDKLEKSERYLLYWAINYPEVRINLKGEGFRFVHQNYQRIFDSLLSYVDSENIEEEINVSDFMNILDDEDKNLLADLEMMNMPDEYNDQEIEDYVDNIKNSAYDAQITELNQQLKKAAMVGDNKLQLDLAKQLISIRRILSNN